MGIEHRCPRCGAPVTETQARGGNCPACLLRIALATPEEAPKAAAATAPEAADLNPGERLGPYRVVRLLGEGGMGRVWLAEQDEPVARKVALKVIKLGMDTEKVVARFEAERRALGRMDHPSIARVFDAGCTAGGRPYFVMEYIDGEPITDWSDGRRLDVRSRLELFLQVCDAVQHAHRKGVIHRDIKPSNVLVTESDGKALCKVIDFGVAKAIEQRLTERSLFTEMGVLLGTPEYMSPEQAELTPLDVDTRTDVYSLGVLLYRLLTGFQPFEPESLRGAALGEVLRRIREDRPSRPSTRISEAGERAADLARLRRLDVSGLRRCVAGDLDVITLKALEKDRGRRYESPADLAADIGRHLRDEPVLARAPSAAYQLRKLVARHKLPAVLAASLLLTLVGFGLWMSVLYGRSQANLGRALAAEATAQEVSRFLVGVFELSDPSESRGERVTARELLDQARARIATELPDQPGVRAELLATMGNVYRSLGLEDRAEPLAREAVEVLSRLRGAEDPQTLRAAVVLGLVYTAQGRWDEAERILRETLAAQTRLLGLEHPDTLRTQGDLGALYSLQGRFEEAEALTRSTLEGERRVLGGADAQTLLSTNNLARIYRDESRYDEAERLLSEALDQQRAAHGDDHPATLFLLVNLAGIRREQGRPDEAEPLYREALAGRTRVLGEEHPDTVAALNGLASLLAEQHRFDEAESSWRRVLEIQQRAGRADHPDTLSYAGNLAFMLQRRGDVAAAEPLLVETLAGKRRVLGASHPKTLSALNALGILYLESGRPERAEPLFDEALAGQLDTLGPDHVETLRTMSNLALVYGSTGRAAKAESMLLETLAGQERALGPDHPQVGITAHNLANLMRDAGRFDRAGPLYERAQRIWDERLGPSHPYALANLAEHAALLRKQGREAGARELEAQIEERRATAP